MEPILPGQEKKMYNGHLSEKRQENEGMHSGWLEQSLCGEMQKCTKPTEKRSEGRGQGPQGKSGVGTTI